MVFRKRSYRRRYRSRRKGYASKFKKKTRSRYTVQKIAQAVINHNTWAQLFNNLTMTKQGVENQPGTNFAKNRIGSSIRPLKLWIKGIIQLQSTPTGYPITKCMVRFVLVRRPMSQTIGGTAPALPQGIPPSYAQTSQTNLNTFPCNFMSNIDYRQCTTVYDKVHSIKVNSMTQSDAAPTFAARGNEQSQMFNMNISIGKWCRGTVDYSFRELSDPSGLDLPKKYCFQLWAIPWTNSAYDPDYVFSAPACNIIAQSRLYFKDG